MCKRFFLLLVCALAACCSPKTKEEARKPLLLVSLPPYETLVQTIAGSEFEVEAVVPINADPHNYEPTSKQLSTIAAGKIWFRIGESFEQKLLPLLKNTKVLDLRQNLPLIEGSCKHHDHEDLHLWLSPKLMVRQAEQVSAALSQAFPTREETFRKNLQLLKDDLEQLDREIDGRLQSAENRIFLVSHPAFAYFCRDYDCRQLAVEHEGKEPRPKELEATLKDAIEQHAALAIALPQHNNKGAQLIAEKLRIPVRFVDPYAADYFNTLRKLSELIANPYAPDERD
ncbi:MAG TPA: zinc ABC transporter substrate-binding protein [Chlamydiales bacterium]|nr:zinc ABC transporter substrate-binding protein [Chlamydiales bacterium]